MRNFALGFIALGLAGQVSAGLDLHRAFDFAISPSNLDQSAAVLLVEGHQIIKSDFVSASAMDDVHFIRIPHLLDKHAASILSKVDVLNFKPGVGAVVAISAEKTAEIAYLAHELNNACGSIVKLDHAPVIPVEMALDPVHATGIKHEAFASLLENVQGERIRSEVAYYLSFHNRFSNDPRGIAFPGALKKRYETLAATHGRAVEFDLVPARGENSQESVIVRILGTTKPEEIVILGSHLDNTCYNCADQRMYGEDDNASGTGTNYEVFRTILENNIQFERTVEIHAYAAEEQGLVGSNVVATQYKNANKNVIAMLQNDMNLSNPNKLIRIAFDQTGSRQLTTALIELMTSYMPEIPTRLRGIPGSSDHASWTRKGYHAAFPWEDVHHGAIHTSGDHASPNFDYEQAAVFGRLSLLFTLHFAGGTN